METVHLANLHLDVLIRKLHSSPHCMNARTLNWITNKNAVLEYLGVTKIPRFNSMEKTCEYVTDRMIEKYKSSNVCVASDINYGYCFIWAYLVYALAPKDYNLSFLSTTAHVVVTDKDNGLSYDSVAPYGDDPFVLLDVELDDEGNEVDPSVELDRQQMVRFWVGTGSMNNLFLKLVQDVECTAEYDEYLDRYIGADFVVETVL
jgi:hypothetical protein